MSEKHSWVDQILGYGGMALVIVSVIVQMRSSALGEGNGLEIPAAVLGIATLAWIVAITMRHLWVYRKSGGRGALIASWVLAIPIAGIVLMSGGFAGAEGNNPIGDRAVELLGSPHAYLVLLAVPLLLASAAILIDGEGELPHDAGKVSGTYGWH